MPYTTRRRWAAPAPAVPVPAPAVTLVAQQPVPGGRHLRFQLAMNGAETVTLIAPPEARLQGAGAGAFVRRFGHGADTDKYYLRCIGRACDGAMMDVLVGSAQPVDFTIIGARAGCRRSPRRWCGPGRKRRGPNMGRMRRSRWGAFAPRPVIARAAQPRPGRFGGSD